jgi:hypothetical protein
VVEIRAATKGAAHVDGAANVEVIARVAEALALRRAEVELVSGATSRRKRLRAYGDAAELSRRLRALAAATHEV